MSWAYPPGNGYGYVGIGETGPYPSWWELIRPRDNPTLLPETGDEFSTWQARVDKQMRRFEPYFHAVPPSCFLDDITVKNVIVHNGELQGLVDFDCVCYGDPLFWLALTTTGVISDVGPRGLFYVQELTRLWQLSPEQEGILALYTTSMALDFLRRFSASETPRWRKRMQNAVEHSLQIAAQTP